MPAIRGGLPLVVAVALVAAASLVSGRAGSAGRTRAWTGAEIEAMRSGN